MFCMSIWIREINVFKPSKPAQIWFFFLHKYQGKSGQVLNAFDDWIALVFLLLAEYHLKRMFQEPFIRHSYQFPNLPSHERHSWNVDDVEWTGGKNA